MTPQEKAARGPVRGRPKIDPGDKLVNYTVRLPADEADRLRRLGSATVRAWLMSKKMPKEAT